MKRCVWVALLVALALTGAVFGVVACGGGSGVGIVGDEGAVPGGTLSVYINEPVSIEPLDLGESEGVKVGDALFDGLAAYDALTGELIPAAAESWEANEDATVWTFYLDPNAKFHDGSPVTAQDFVYAWNRLSDPANESSVSWHLEPVKGWQAMQEGTATELEGVKAIDDNTLEVTLEYSYGDFEYVVGHQTLAPVPQAVVEEMGQDAFAEAPVGNGPFMVAPGTKWEHNQKISVVEFADYYGEVPNIDGVDFMIYVDPAAAFLEFEAGNLDFAQIPLGQIESTVAKYGQSEDGYTADPGKQTLLGDELATYYLSVNVEDGGMSNLDLRKAISLAINRETICDVVMEGTRAPADNFVPNGVLGYEPGTWEYSKYDLEAAKQYLADAGYPDGAGAPEITLSAATGGGSVEVWNLVQSDLEALGLSCEQEYTEGAAYLEKLQAGEYQIGPLSWTADYPIFDNFMFSTFYSESANNFSGYKNPEVDAMMTEARATTDTAARIAKWQEINEVIQADVPVIPIMFGRHGQVCSDRVNNLVYSAMGLLDYTHCWITESAQ